MLNMNETIRSRRHAQGMTQEQLADRLGVSAPAVSKWEQGASYPDVTLLPALARALGIDLNTLMGFARTPEKAEVARMLTRVNDAAKAKGIEAGLTLAKEFAREYPSCGALLFGLAATLEGRMIMAGMTQEERGPVSVQLEDWYVRAADSEDEEARESAAYLLAGRALGRGDADAAQAMMARLPREPATARWTLETGLLLARGEREQAAAYVQKTLFARAGDMQQMLLRLIQMALDADEPGRAQALADLTERFVELLCMHPYVGHLAQLMPALARKDVQTCMTHVHAMLAALQAPWSPGACLPYDRAGLGRGAPSDMLGGIVREMEQSEEYAFLREHADFRALLAQYGSTLNPREAEKGV
ncbi:MAG: helix-turn-helix domain-containing protein [Candidatus Ventricola sp.]